MAKAKSGAVRAEGDGNAGRELVLGGCKNGAQMRTGRETDWNDLLADQFIAGRNPADHPKLGDIP